MSMLIEIENSNLPEVGDDSYVLRHSDHTFVDRIEVLAQEILISEDGDPIYDKMDQLFREYGFFIFPGDRDQFGWLTGCLRTKKGIIVFG